MTKPLAEQFDLEDELVGFGLERGQARKFMSMLKVILSTAETEIRADEREKTEKSLLSIYRKLLQHSTENPECFFNQEILSFLAKENTQ